MNLHRELCDTEVPVQTGNRRVQLQLQLYNFTVLKGTAPFHTNFPFRNMHKELKFQLPSPHKTWEIYT
jgi:hypothetical protein